MTGEQVQWALEHLDIDARRLKQLGATGFMPPLKTSCADHEGSGLVRFMRWNGARWHIETDWMAPTPKTASWCRRSTPIRPCSTPARRALRRGSARVPDG